MTRKRVQVHGVVQGVGFRYLTRAEAERLGVAGFVRNLPDGSVEAEVEGDPSAVGHMLDWLRAGPSGARVDRIEVHDAEPVGEDRFRISR